MSARLQEEAELFGPSVPDELRRPWALGTPAMSKMDQDASWALTGTARALADAFGLPPSRCSYLVCSQARDDKRLGILGVLSLATNGLGQHRRGVRRQPAN